MPLNSKSNKVSEWKLGCKEVNENKQRADQSFGSHPAGMPAAAHSEKAEASVIHTSTL